MGGRNYYWRRTWCAGILQLSSVALALQVHVQLLLGRRANLAEVAEELLGRCRSATIGTSCCLSGSVICHQREVCRQNVLGKVCRRMPLPLAGLGVEVSVLERLQAVGPTSVVAAREVLRGVLRRREAEVAHRTIKVVGSQGAFVEGRFDRRDLGPTLRTQARLLLGRIALVLGSPSREEVSGVLVVGLAVIVRACLLRGIDLNAAQLAKQWLALGQERLGQGPVKRLYPGGQVIHVLSGLPCQGDQGGAIGGRRGR